MKVGDLVKYSHASVGELGIIVGWQEAYRTEPQPVVRWYDKCIVFQVLDNSGQVVQVREDEASLELINEGR